MQHFRFLGCSGGSSAAKIASSNTFFKPLFYSKLHFLKNALTLSKDFSSSAGGSRAAKIASSNTIFSPCCLE